MDGTRFGSLLRLIAAVAIVAASCGGGDAAARTSWGDEAVAYFDAWSQALRRDDVYGVLDFYAPGAMVEGRKGGFEGSIRPVADWVSGHRADLGQDLDAVFLGEGAAVVTVDWPAAGDHGAYVTTMDGGAIAGQAVFVDVSSLERGLLASPDVAALYRDLYAATAGVRSVEGAPWSTVAEPSLYLDPGRYGHDPGRAVAVYAVADDGCEYRVAVEWRLAGGAIAEERLFREVETTRACPGASLPTGWWTGLELPGPRDEAVTGVIEAGSGLIEVHNGTAGLEDLVRWGLGRFDAAGLEAPRVDSVTFEPTRHCEGVFGRLGEVAGSRDLVLCIDDADLCAGGSCDTVPLGVRAGMLHELGHAWLIDHADAATRDRLLGLSGREAWSDDAVPWVDRGVEYAAEVISWGLSDEPLPLAHLGSPPCEQVQSAFVLLTGVDPLPRSGGCRSTTG
jgi:hypothetical protein